jgi:hypothetical protein
MVPCKCLVDVKPLFTASPEGAVSEHHAAVAGPSMSLASRPKVPIRSSKSSVKGASSPTVIQRRRATGRQRLAPYQRLSVDTDYPGAWSRRTCQLRTVSAARSPDLPAGQHRAAEGRGAHVLGFTIRKSPSFVHPSGMTSLETTTLALPVPEPLTCMRVALASAAQPDAAPSDGLESTRQKPGLPESGSTYSVTK